MPQMCHTEHTCMRRGTAITSCHTIMTQIRHMPHTIKCGQAQQLPHLTQEYTAYTCVIRVNVHMCGDFLILLKNNSCEDPNYVPIVTGGFRAFWLLINIYHIMVISSSYSRITRAADRDSHMYMCHTRQCAEAWQIPHLTGSRAHRMVQLAQELAAFKSHLDQKLHSHNTSSSKAHASGLCLMFVHACVCV